MCIYIYIYTYIYIYMNVFVCNCVSQSGSVIVEGQMLLLSMCCRLSASGVPLEYSLAQLRHQAGSKSMSKGRFRYPRSVVCVQEEMCSWNMLWGKDDTQKALIQRRRTGFATLDMLYAFDRRCTSGVNLGIAATPRSHQFNVEGLLLPSMCWVISTQNLPP